MISQFITKAISRIRFKHLFWIFYYLFLFFLLLNNSFNYFDPDFGWHIKVGQEISLTGEVPSQNTYNYTYRGTWVDHEWLGDFWLYKAYNSLGYIVVSVIFSLLMVIVLAGLSFFTIRRWPSVSLVILVVAQTFGLLAALPSLGVRLQELGLLFAFVLLVIIDHYDRHRRSAILAVLPLIFYFWASLHASFLLGLFLLVSWLAVKISELLLSRTRIADWFNRTRLITKKQAAIYAGWSMVTVLATLITPYKQELFTFLGDYRDSFYQLHIGEWLPQYIFPLHYKQLIYLALVATAVILFIKYSQKKNQIELWQMFLILLFFVMSWKARRHFPLLLVATLPYLVFMVSSLVIETRGGQDWQLKPWLRVYLIVCLILSSLSLAIKTNFTASPFNSYCQDYPCGAARYLEENPKHDSQNLFNNYSWGGYLIWRLPERKLFIDGRLPQVKFADKTFLEEYYDFFSENIDHNKKLSEYNIKLVLIHSQDKPLSVKDWEKKVFKLNDSDLKTPNHLRDYLESAGWLKVYVDSTAVIYERPLDYAN